MARHFKLEPGQRLYLPYGPRPDFGTAELNAKIQPYGHLTVVNPSREDRGFYSGFYWLHCDCGTRPYRVRLAKIRQRLPLMSVRMFSCGCADEEHQRLYGAISLASQLGAPPKSQCGRIYGKIRTISWTTGLGWLCECVECGIKCYVRYSNMLDGVGKQPCGSPQCSAKYGALIPEEIGRLALGVYDTDQGFECTCLGCGNLEYHLKETLAQAAFSRCLVCCPAVDERDVRDSSPKWDERTEPEEEPEEPESIQFESGLNGVETFDSYQNRYGYVPEPPLPESWKKKPE